jgi:hypothetical protein
MKKYMVVLTEDEMKILKENRINLNRKVSLDELTDMSSDEALTIIKNYLYMDIDEMDKKELKNFEDTMESFAYDRGSFAALVKKYIKEHDDETETRYSDGRGTPLFNLQKKCFEKMKEAAAKKPSEPIEYSDEDSDEEWRVVSQMPHREIWQNTKTGKKKVIYID